MCTYDWTVEIYSQARVSEVICLTIKKWPSQLAHLTYRGACEEAG
jgi:hypothetical protein